MTSILEMEWTYPQKKNKGEVNKKENNKQKKKEASD